jgi:hypothetical protein
MASSILLQVQVKQYIITELVWLKAPSNSDVLFYHNLATQSSESFILANMCLYVKAEEGN